MGAYHVFCDEVIGGGSRSVDHVFCEVVPSLPTKRRQPSPPSCELYPPLHTLPSVCSRARSSSLLPAFLLCRCHTALNNAPLPHSTTIGFQLASTTPVFLGLTYAELVGVVYVTLACCVFCMVLLCEPEGDYRGRDGMSTMGGAETAFGTLRFASKISVDQGGAEMAAAAVTLDVGTGVYEYRE